MLLLDQFLTSVMELSSFVNFKSFDDNRQSKLKKSVKGEDEKNAKH